VQVRFNAAARDSDGPGHRRFAEPDSDGPDSFLNGRRAVIVEDEGITQLQLRRILRSARVIVVGTASTGAEGIETALRERPDLVLMDIRMPGEIDGIDAARSILAETPVCVVMLTAFSQDIYRQRTADIPICGYIVKPVSAESLVPQLEAAMRQFLASG